MYVCIHITFLGSWRNNATVHANSTAEEESGKGWEIWRVWRSSGVISLCKCTVIHIDQPRPGLHVITYAYCGYDSPISSIMVFHVSLFLISHIWNIQCHTWLRFFLFSFSSLHSCLEMLCVICLSTLNVRKPLIQPGLIQTNQGTLRTVHIMAMCISTSMLKCIGLILVFT